MMLDTGRHSLSFCATQDPVRRKSTLSSQLDLVIFQPYSLLLLFRQLKQSHGVMKTNAANKMFMYRQKKKKELFGLPQGFLALPLIPALYKLSDLGQVAALLQPGSLGHHIVFVSPYGSDILQS